MMMMTNLPPTPTTVVVLTIIEVHTDPSLREGLSG